MQEEHSDKQHEIHALFTTANVDSIFQKPSHFDFHSIVNNKTLYGLEEDATDEDIYKVILKKLRKFHAAFYSSDLLSLAIIDKRSVEDIERIVKEHFKIIPKRRAVTKKSIDEKLVYPFTDKHLGQLVKYKTIETNSISIVYNLSDVHQDFKHKPLKFFLYFLHDNA